jgi:hypothetical protein
MPDEPYIQRFRCPGLMGGKSNRPCGRPDEKRNDYFSGERKTFIHLTPPLRINGCFYDMSELKKARVEVGSGKGPYCIFSPIFHEMEYYF